eukprot:1183357-Prorocentrum_minimum.AAC.4
MQGECQGKGCEGVTYLHRGVLVGMQERWEAGVNVEERWEGGASKGSGKGREVGGWSKQGERQGERGGRVEQARGARDTRSPEGRSPQSPPVAAVGS